MFTRIPQTRLSARLRKCRFAQRNSTEFPPRATPLSCPRIRARKDGTEPLSETSHDNDSLPRCCSDKWRPDSQHAVVGIVDRNYRPRSRRRVEHVALLSESPARIAAVQLSRLDTRRQDRGSHRTSTLSSPPRAAVASQLPNAAQRRSLLGRSDLNRTRHRRLPPSPVRIAHCALRHGTRASETRRTHVAARGQRTDAQRNRR